MGHYLGCTTWRQVCQTLRIDYDSLPGHGGSGRELEPKQLTNLDHRPSSRRFQTFGKISHVYLVTTLVWLLTYLPIKGIMPLKTIKYRRIYGRCQCQPVKRGSLPNTSTGQPMVGSVSSSSAEENPKRAVIGNTGFGAPGSIGRCLGCARSPGGIRKRADCLTDRSYRDRHVACKSEWTLSNFAAECCAGAAQYSKRRPAVGRHPGWAC